MIGRTFGNYRIEALLGEGGIGAVYRAVDQILDRPVAIKVLRPELIHDTRFVERFRAEAASLARLNHPNITTVYTLYSEPNQLMMVIELVNGRTLEDLLIAGGRFSEAECLSFASQATEGFAYAHRAGIVHRDIKPANLMITADGMLKIMDFGIARIRGSQRMTRTGHIIGTLAYMAPEQIQGREGDERSDIYSLAIVLYELLSGVPPFVADSEYQLLKAQVEQPPERLLARLPGADPTLDAAVMRALAKSPDERFGSMAAFARALGAGISPGEARETLTRRVGATVERLWAAQPVSSPSAPAAATAIAGAPLAAGRGLIQPPQPAPTPRAAEPTIVAPGTVPGTAPGAVSGAAGAAAAVPSAAVAAPAGFADKWRIPLPAVLLAASAVALIGLVGYIFRDAFTGTQSTPTALTAPGNTPPPVALTAPDNAPPAAPPASALAPAAPAGSETPADRKAASPAPAGREEARSEPAPSWAAPASAPAGPSGGSERTQLQLGAPPPAGLLSTPPQERVDKPVKSSETAQTQRKRPPAKKPAARKEGESGQSGGSGGWKIIR